MDCVRIGVIGVGGMGSVHVRYLLNGEVKRGQLTAICDVDPAKLAEFPEVKSFADSAALIRSGEVDAVIIATPHYAHTTIGIDALEQGLHVLTEKPISVHKADALRLIAAHEGCRDRVFAAMFQLRTNPVWKRIRSLIEDGELGEVQRTFWSITAWYRTEAYYASGGWRATWKGEGGGVLLNQCPHNLDLFQWMCGMPARVRAFCGWGRYHDIEVEDEVTAYLEYPNGATGLFMASTGEAPGTDRLEIAGERGKLVYEDNRLTFYRNVTSARTFSKTSPNGFDKPEMWTCAIPIPDVKTGHVVVAQNFVEAILDGTPLIAPAEEGLHSVELANAMIYSSLTGQTVPLPLDAGAYEAKLQSLITASRFEKKAVAAKADDIQKSFR